MKRTKQLEGDDSVGLVYATPDANDYEEKTTGQAPTSDQYCEAAVGNGGDAGDLTAIASSVLADGVNNVVSQVRQAGRAIYSLQNHAERCSAASQCSKVWFTLRHR